MATDDLVMQGARASAAKVMPFLMVKTSLIPFRPPAFPIVLWLILYLHFLNSAEVTQMF